MQSNRNAAIKRRASSTETSARLRSTPQGLALIELLSMYHSREALAKAIGSSVSYIALCVHNGKISKSGALLAEKAGIMAKEKLRPDLTADDWAETPAGLPIGCKHEMTGHQQILLRDLAAHFGSVKAFCHSADIEIRSFHHWKTLNKISSHGVIKLANMSSLTRELRARIKDLQR